MYSTLVYKVCLEKIQSLLIQREWFAQHQCDLAAKESELECTCVNNDDSTVLVSGGSRRCWVSTCTVWPLHSKWLSEYSNETATDFVLSLNSPRGNYSDVQKAAAMGNWRLAASSRQRSCSCIASYAKFFGKILNHPGDSAPLQLRFGTLRLLVFPQN